MTLLDVITAAAAASTLDALPTAPPSSHPLPLSADRALRHLRPSSDNPPNPLHLVHPVSNFHLSNSDSQLAQLNHQFHTQLNRSLKNQTGFDKNRFITLLNSFLTKVSDADVDNDNSDLGHCVKMVKKNGDYFGDQVGLLVLEGCVRFEIWEVVRVMIVNKFVPFNGYGKLIDWLVESRRSDLLCECVKWLVDLQYVEVLSVLRYFLVPMSDAREGLGVVREEWERMVKGSLDRVKEGGKDWEVARAVAVWMMMACDRFTDGEVCLHYLFAGAGVEGLVLRAAIGRLNGREVMALVRYLGKWVRKYERFPVVGVSVETAVKKWVKAVQWVPKIEDVVRCLGLVVDEHFTSLVMLKEFHEEIRSLEGVVGELVSEAQLCCSVANVAGNLREMAQTQVSSC